ncbi:MAG: tyrosine-type recombinase/integrase [Candidatus Dojkabacteria bacterium]|nr:MAG: tyrosine-type recombinase/integrase [Candidatus Dojkabacteria bacterium]
MALVNELVVKFIEYLKNTGKSESTLVAYRKDIEQMRDFLLSKGIHNVEEIKIDDLKPFLEYLRVEKGFNLKTISRKINSIRTFFKFLREQGAIAEDSDPSLKLTHPKIESKLPRVLNRVEYRALRDASRADVRLYTMVEILLQTGLRIGELQRLQVEDIKVTPLGHRYLQIQTFGSHQNRNVPLNETAYQAIQDYLKVRPTAAGTVKSIFLTKSGNAIPIRNMRSAIKRAFSRAGIKNATVNDIRNTFIAHHLANGVNVLTVAKIVGHKRISTTEKYLEILKPKEGSDKLGEL